MEPGQRNQKVKLNQLYWVAYYSQIISAEIATIFFNQTSAAGLYGSKIFASFAIPLILNQLKNGHISMPLKSSAKQFEDKVFGERLFTYPMRGPYVETIIFRNAGKISQFWRWLQLNAFTLLSSQNAFIACQYFTVRGIRTLNGKIIQHQLSQFYSKDTAQDKAPIPSRVSYLHFLDESYHFNSSTIISHDILKCLKPPTRFESHVANLAIMGAQKDHYHFSSAINGLFWYDPALFEHAFRILTGPVFKLEDQEALQMMDEIFVQENEGTQLSFESKQLAQNSYREYLANIEYVSKPNKDMALMAESTLENHKAVNREALTRFIRMKVKKIMEHYSVSFESAHEAITLEAEAILSEHLNVDNSPVLFGCRTGICGTCLVEVSEGELSPPSSDEVELLSLIAPGNSRARLACQLKLSSSIKIKYMGSF